MTSRTEKLANNYVWKNEYNKEYGEKLKTIQWNHENDAEKWEKIKTDSGRTILRLKKQ